MGSVGPSEKSREAPLQIEGTSTERGSRIVLKGLQEPYLASRQAKKLVRERGKRVPEEKS